MNATADVDAGARAHAPHCAGEIPKPIDRHDSGAFERGDEERAHQMRKMVFDVVERGLQARLCGIEHLGEKFCVAPDASGVLKARADQFQTRPVSKAEQCFL